MLINGTPAIFHTTPLPMLYGLTGSTTYFQTKTLHNGRLQWQQLSVLLYPMVSRHVLLSRLQCIEYISHFYRFTPIHRPNCSNGVWYHRLLTFLMDVQYMQRLMYIVQCPHVFFTFIGVHIQSICLHLNMICNPSLPSTQTQVKLNNRLFIFQCTYDVLFHRNSLYHNDPKSPMFKLYVSHCEFNIQDFGTFK